ncbi:MAG: YraN family protein [Anaerolineales bacterium]|nr:YraN family protein [Anaerolineales bacterium]
MKTARQTLGNWGESLAADYLRQRGYTILERNVRTPHGEIDLIARQARLPRAGENQVGMVTVFVEVKTRSSGSFGLPEEAVTARKQERLLASAQAYLQNHPELEGDWRVDVIAIQRSRSSRAPLITHFENAVT